MRRTLSGIGLLLVEDNDERIVFDFSRAIENADDVHVVTTGKCDST